MASSRHSVSDRSWGEAALKLGHRWLYIVHRWVGIATCILCAMWFVSGVVMMYVPYPALSDPERMALADPVDWSQVKVSPDQALAMAGEKRYPTDFRLTTMLGSPVYRIRGAGPRITVSAVDGTRLQSVNADTAIEVVRRARPDAPNLTVQTLQRDQWTVAQGFTPHRPLHKVSLGDAAGTQLYVSSKTGEIVNDTTRMERFWNWLGSVPHWIYPTVLRQDGDAWRQVVLWTSGPAVIGAILGIWVGILRLRLRRRYANDRVSPYRGWMKWHHISGLIAGLVLTTWLFSGWLSVNPFRLFERTPAPRSALARYMGQDKPTFSDDAAPLRKLPSGAAREGRLIWFAKRPYVVLMGRDLVEHLYDARTGAPAPLTDADIFANAGKLVDKGAVVSKVRMTQEDDYWYSHHTIRRLPVLRVTYADPDKTWVHLDPVTGEVLGRSNAGGRVYRWLFNFLHDFDIRLFLHHRPLWDVVVILLSIGGMIISVTSVVIGWRRLGRKLQPKPKPRPKPIPPGLPAAAE